MAFKKYRATSNIQLGLKVKDLVSGHTGMAISKAIYINGCVQYEVMPEVKKDGSKVNGRWIDWQRLEVVGQGIAEKNKPTAKQTGGPEGNAPSSG